MRNRETFEVRKSPDSGPVGMWGIYTNTAMADPPSSSFISNFTVLQTLHKGYSSSLKVATQSSSPFPLLLKLFPIAPPILPPPLTHPHIVQVYSSSQSCTYYSKKGESKQVAYVAEELCRGGGVFDYLAMTGTLADQTSRTIVSQVLKGLIFAKERGIPHEALKPENLLFANDFTVKISDFGLGKRSDWSPFTSPEVLSGTSYEPFSSDIFSLGVLLYSLQFGFLPFNQANPSDTQYHLFLTNKSFFWQQRRGRLLYPTPGHHFIALIDWMCAHNPASRPTLEEVQTHGWMTGHMVEETALRLAIARVVRECEEDRARKKLLLQRRKAVQSAGNSFRGLEWENDTEEIRTPARYHHFRSTYFRLFCLFTPVQTTYLLRSFLKNREGYSFSEHPSRYHFEVRYRDQYERETVMRLEVRVEGDVVVLEMRKFEGSFFVFWHLFNLVKAEMNYSESLFSLTA